MCVFCAGVVFMYYCAFDDVINGKPLLISTLFCSIDHNSLVIVSDTLLYSVAHTYLVPSTFTHGLRAMNYCLNAEHKISVRGRQSMQYSNHPVHCITFIIHACMNTQIHMWKALKTLQSPCIITCTCLKLHHDTSSLGTQLQTLG